jgi:hypothetical protein
VPDEPTIAPAAAEASVESRAGSAAAAAEAELMAEPVVAPLAEPVVEPLTDSLAVAGVPVRVSVEFTPEQFARWEALLEKLAKSGVAGDRAELLLDALVCKLDDVKSTMTNSSAKTAPRGAGRSETPTWTTIPDPSSAVVLVPDSVPAEIPTADPVPVATQGPVVAPSSVPDVVPVLSVAPVPAAVSVESAPGQRNTTTIAPRLRREVLARDRHRCRAPGCGRTRFLEVHHVKPRRRGGTNDRANLITLCAACPRLWHERGGGLERASGGASVDGAESGTG